MINASPDVAGQLEALRDGQSARILAVVLTDAEPDHTLGLLRLREGDTPLEVVATPYVRRALSEDFPIDTVLSNWAGLSWRELSIDSAPIRLDGLAISAFATCGGGPRYAGQPDDRDAVVGLAISDASATLVCAPSVAAIDESVATQLQRADCVLFDGTCWSDDELLGIRERGRTASAMGHLALDGPAGSLRSLEPLGIRWLILTHVNNTNPVLIEDSPQRAELRARGIEVAHHGMDFEL